MTQELPISPRQLFITPSVKWFLEHCGQTDYIMALTQAIYDAVCGRMERDDCIFCPARSFLIKVFAAPDIGQPERVLVWDAQVDGGALFSNITPESILEESALSWGIGLQ